MEKRKENGLRPGNNWGTSKATQDVLPLQSFRKGNKDVCSLFFLWLYATELNLNHTKVFQTGNTLNTYEKQ